MTRYAIDAQVAIRMVRDSVVVPAAHQLVAPTLLRSQVLSTLFRQVREGELEESKARRQLDSITTMKIRLLGDRVSRSTAWQIARQLDWEDTTDAEYVAVAKLQADFFVTLDTDLARQVKNIVSTAPFEALGESNSVVIYLPKR